MVSNNKIKVSVIDSGVGMDEIELEEIYEILRHPEKAALYQKNT